MKIALVTTSYPAYEGDPCGHFVHAEAGALRAAGHELTVLQPRAGGAFGWPGVVARLRSRPWLVGDVGGFVSAARARLRSERFDYVVAHWAVPCGFPIAMAADDGRAAGGRGTSAGERAADVGRCAMGSPALELVSHGADVRFLCALPRPIRTHVVNVLATRANTWRFVSATLLDALLAELPERMRAHVERIAVVEPALIEMPSDAWIEEQARTIRATVEGRLLVSVGRLVPSKRVDAAIAYACRSANATTLAIVGDGPERRRLESLARAEDVRRGHTRVLFTGLLPRNETLAWIRAADEVLHASEAEGRSTVVREAEALGTTVRRLSREGFSGSLR
jgi:glycosyltransferase involved in cell wall biosynthesis